MGKCLYPRTIKRVIYGVSQGITIPCGKCVECLSTKRQVWLFRLLQELKVSSTCYFVTLTYDDEHITWEYDRQQLNKRDVQLFLKRLRKKYGKGIRYFLCGEYGTNTFRPHYHMLLFNLPEQDNTPSKIKLSKKIESIWQNGHVDIGDTVGANAINYCAKYIMYAHQVEDRLVKPFILTSRRPGLGANYANNDDVRNYYHNNPDAYALQDGCKLALPRFYSTKIFTPEELEERYYTNKDKREKEMKDKIRHDFATKTYSQRSMEERNDREARKSNEINKKKFLTKTRQKL